jgi:hypothetical protein
MLAAPRRRLSNYHLDNFRVFAIVNFCRSKLPSFLPKQPIYLNVENARTFGQPSSER